MRFDENFNFTSAIWIFADKLRFAEYPWGLFPFHLFTRVEVILDLRIGRILAESIYKSAGNNGSNASS